MSGISLPTPLLLSHRCLQDVAIKLGLSDVGDTEAVIAKTIRDGSISARLDHMLQNLASCETSNVYSTGEPSSAFHVRTAFCMDIHNEAVKAMRFDRGCNTGEDEDSGAHADVDAIAAALSDGSDF